MKTLLILSLFYFLGFSSMVDEKEKVSQAVQEFAKAVVEADESKFLKLLSDDLVYGHSNGSVQDKNAFIAEIISLTPFDYLAVDVENQEITISGNVAVVTHIYVATAENKAMEKVNIRIGNMMVWVKSKSTWKLLSRQAYRLPQ
ncbi:nuclear transport factor 2 family protein [Aquiflexum lacus]|uniref:nuclear transport factor 2 family protein n=1 Tax=Aquiflexum lacus TaxID=2483805 RepID=UPI0018949332|nr:nuclear transport factor 2 family protein [Aquiflexum lacus]